MSTDPIIDRIDAVLAEEPDDIDALVDAALAVGEDVGHADRPYVYEPTCPHCGNEWHGLPEPTCQGSTFIGPMPPRTRIRRRSDGEVVSVHALTAAGGWVAPSEQLYEFSGPIGPFIPDDLAEAMDNFRVQRGGIRYPEITAVTDTFVRTETDENGQWYVVVPAVDLGHHRFEELRIPLGD